MLAELVSFVTGPINSFLWGPFMLVALLGVGLMLMVRLNFMPLLRIPMAFGLMWKGRAKHSDHEGELSPFNALMTALAATVGTGNIAGVATAIYFGGPGAVFWMWCTALVGMATTYTEVTLSVRYRNVTPDGSYVGGPMFYIRNGLGSKWNWLAAAFAFFGCIAGFGIGNGVQVNSIADGLNTTFNVPHGASAAVLFLLVGLVLVGGVQRIGNVAGKLVPFMAIVYIIASLGCLTISAEYVPRAFLSIFTEAFSPRSAGAGVLGGLILETMRRGISRGVFSNEAGMGSSPIAHATAVTNNPVRQGIIGMLGTFLDTIVICTMTALVILVAQIWSNTYTLDTAKLAAALDARKSELVSGGAIDKPAVVGAFTPEMISGVTNKSHFTEGHGIPSAAAMANFMPANIGAIIEKHKAELVQGGIFNTAAFVARVNEAQTNDNPADDVVSSKNGASLSANSFSMCLPGTAGQYIVSLSLALFAFTTILGWCVYSERCAVYLFGHKALKPFRLVYTVFVPCGALLQLGTVWDIADTFNAMMMIPNLLALVLLHKVVVGLTNDYFTKGEQSVEMGATESMYREK